MPPNGLLMHYSQEFHSVWGAENPNHFWPFLFYFLFFTPPSIVLSGQVIALPFGVFTPPGPIAVWSHWVSITTNPIHSFKINGCGPFADPRDLLCQAFFSQHLKD